MKTLLKTQ